MSEPATTVPAPESTPSVVIHIGASSVSMLIAETNEEGCHIPIDILEQPAPLARDIFRHGEITSETIERIVTILSGFADTARENGIRLDAASRAVATNIIIEATNHERFLNRIRIACGLAIAPIDDGEMTRLIYLKTRRRLKDMPAMQHPRALVIHVGPGNTRALFFEESAITRYTSYRMGAHRTREAIEGSHNGGAAMLRVIRESGSANLTQLRFDYLDARLDALVLIGYEIQQVASFLTDTKGISSRKLLRRLARQASEMSELELVQHFQIDYQTAEALVPALEINLAIAESLGSESLHIPSSDYERGLLLDLLVSSNLTDSLDQEVLRSARILSSRYQSDPSHGEHVGRISLHLFEQLQALHGMGQHDALLLHVAAILHEVGTYVSPRAHHKHSEYIILNSEIFGLDRRDVTIIALVSRYHRHSGPKLDHPIYAALDTADRILVSKLAAILRVADALERTHAQRVRDIIVSLDNSRLKLRLPGVTDVAVERLAMQGKGDLFAEVFGLDVFIEDPA
ncbi:exopolyphosphatase/guanosine-5'-triphosphate,3'-diphosphate pyrophosphatase [Haloferula luteola]|uniref:Exopolyphosphatase/guanosine-5'-triphosphate, 3'-diphosphate pyrophosphatase n=1 Tax=Haloferula luteola TaxID=595692 RepID=A0A840VEB6_9BACT|nr:HD domain-containing protein [Haloferula luteola]MBB5351181.1 exopolyphosphatase/guanosine-5'-triphosphate,3'-diphosphate pyrophosphatase [Haloferula luteola]